MKYVILKYCQLFTLLFGAFNSNSQNLPVTVPGLSIGIILQDTTIKCTGFVAKSPKFIFSCNHCIDSNSNNFFFVDHFLKHHKIKIKERDTVNDALIFESFDEITNDYLDFDETLENNENILYLGFDSFSSLKNNSINMGADYSKIFEINNSAIIKSFTFWAKAIPGYSGSPVFNMKSKVIGFVNKGLRNSSNETKDLNDRSMNKIFATSSRAFINLLK